MLADRDLYWIAAPLVGLIVVNVWYSDSALRWWLRVLSRVGRVRRWL